MAVGAVVRRPSPHEGRVSLAASQCRRAVLSFYVGSAHSTVVRNAAHAGIARVGWWDVRFVTDRGGRVEVGQPLIIYAIGGQGVVGVKGPTF